MEITRYPEKFGDHRYRLRVEFTEQDDEFNRGNLVPFPDRFVNVGKPPLTLDS